MASNIYKCDYCDFADKSLEIVKGHEELCAKKPLLTKRKTISKVSTRSYYYLGDGKEIAGEEKHIAEVTYDYCEVSLEFLEKLEIPSKIVLTEDLNIVRKNPIITSLNNKYAPKNPIAAIVIDTLKANGELLAKDIKRIIRKWLVFTPRETSLHFNTVVNQAVRNGVLEKTKKGKNSRGYLYKFSETSKNIDLTKSRKILLEKCPEYVITKLGNTKSELGVYDPNSPWPYVIIKVMRGSDLPMTFKDISDKTTELTGRDGREVLMSPIYKLMEHAILDRTKKKGSKTYEYLLNKDYKKNIHLKRSRNSADKLFPSLNEIDCK